MNYRFLPKAAFDLTEAPEYYASISSKLDSDFCEEVFAAILRICEHPHAWVEIAPAISPLLGGQVSLRITLFD